MNLLDKINSPKDLKKLSRSELVTLCDEMRDFIIESVSKTGGHLSSNLGVIELTVALHYVFDCPQDKFIWDVGHQTYPHKILTGRKKKMGSLRALDGISGFPKISESAYDIFGTGHSSTSISAALGMAEALKKKNLDHKAIAIIGDGAMTAGMAFEGLNNAGDSKNNILVILNDNDMSISKNVGALNNYLAKLMSGNLYGSIKRSSKAVLSAIPPMLEFAKRAEEHMKGMVIPGTLFEEFGFNYIGPIDGHDLNALVDTLNNLKALQGPQLLHVATQKGFGYEPAETDPNKFHGVGQFSLSDGAQPLKIKKATYTDVFGDWIVDMAMIDKKLCAITPAMLDGSGLNKFSEKFPDRFFDVGIAEQHAITFAAGLACENYKPVIAIYSTFLQRAYDQLIHDVALQNIPMLFAIDRAGIVGQDGPTHSGSFDLSFLRCIPNILIMAPSNENECRQMLFTGFKFKGISVVRYPRGPGPGSAIKSKMTAIPIGKAEVIRKGRTIALLAFGNMLEEALKAGDKINATVVNMRFIKPLDIKLIRDLGSSHKLLVTLEENTISGGAGSAVLEVISEYDLKCQTLRIGMPDKFVEQGGQEQLRKKYGLDAASIIKSIEKKLT
ncbi:1-deoxy-D-xylulose-5-phosphate synthase [Candidatus Methylopumilus universalis]|uniref:1-deoxy-D-xylulose-5-phosphate synthase n=1 Tax=Candidatus Methylopumilus universalis TaxID=2588536 RepID=A0AAX1EYK0_9PROT|nr:1-deoxy-D-xylulose-5-phosphate synthase [Candidatus Methylopumilus universalis]QDC40822.1 1-deoxy-D-xylulose-5-phosphate synthase [Candidatus Methylopumilus universalis]QDC42112.1 1-deoxy-D-xylulose-5-phosphate synthase [Candidatus Methylopumilus universalis]QDC54499.1 1-deoxy-D-xylulose-5-phosphate synthase [Candidatus Methylopumilus universalis]QDC55779.1 1-deoxy-D-xylulose-5-phosphate synthase [Candidatus Methylopumilus universalis]QDC57061.1 1-deoxy-D-xylulose-5-phosphate synthase [Cand